MEEREDIPKQIEKKEQEKIISNIEIHFFYWMSHTNKLHVYL